LNGAQRRRRRELRTRTLVVAALALGGASTALWWSAEQHDGVDTHVRLDLVSEGPGREVVEELHFDPDDLGEEVLRRRIEPLDDGEVALLEVVAHDVEEVLELPRADGGITLAIEGGAGSPVTIRWSASGSDGDEDLSLGTVNAPTVVRSHVGLGGELEVDPGEPIRFGPDDGRDLPWSAAGAVVGVLALGGWLISLRRRRRPDPTSDDVPGLPSDHSPAVVGWLLRHGRVTPADLAATVVDLTARGFIVPFRRGEVLVLGQGRPATDLRPHEALILDWLFADWVRQSDLGAQREAIRDDPSRWSDLWSAFVEQVDAQGRSRDLVEHDVASAPVLTVAAAGLGLLVTGVVGTAHGHLGWLAPIAVGALVLASATAFARRTPEGEALAARWEAFGALLADGDELTPHALAYAVTLGEEAVIPEQASGPWPAQLVHDEVERHVLGWREAYLAATSVRGEPSERVRALLSLRALRRRAPGLTTQADST
jgi:hypothetical protein